MKILFLGGVFASENEKEIISHAKAGVEYSANRFQEKLISGFKHLGDDIAVLSAPFIGAFPMRSDIFFFKGFKEKQNKYKYVNFCNIWGIRNFSRASALKKELKDYIESNYSEKLIVVYSPHTPFVEAAIYAKKRDQRIRICLVVPDLPQYMNLNSKISIVYKIGKKYDIAKFNKLIEHVDSFVLLTEQMASVLNVGSRPYIVVEGVIEKDIFEKNEIQKHNLVKEENLKYIVYTGKLNEKFGVKTLIDAFILISNPNYRLIICGRGDLEEYIGINQKVDNRIIYLGQVTPDVAYEWALKADVLVNPRPNNENYTKYSFPSKNIEYLSTGNVVVAYMLDGMPTTYRDFIIEVSDDKTETLKEVLIKAIEDKSYAHKFNEFKKYAEANITSINIVNRLMAMHKSFKEE